MKLIVAIAALLTVLSTSAEARHAKHHRTHPVRVSAAATCLLDNNGRMACSGIDAHGNAAMPAASYSSSEMSVVGGRPAGCPHAYCGCGTSLHIFGRIIPELNLAANWRRFPPASPAPGMAAWRYGHVFAIESVNSDGTVVAFNPNSGGHRTRVMTVSLRGYHVVDPHGNRMASR